MVVSVHTVQELLARLAANPQVAGIIRYGQRPVPPDEAAGSAEPSLTAAGGDLDLCVVVDERPAELESVHLWVGQLPVDFNLRAWADLQQVEHGKPLTNIDGAICTAEVLYDRDGGLGGRRRGRWPPTSPTCRRCQIMRSR